MQSAIVNDAEIYQSPFLQKMRTPDDIYREWCNDLNEIGFTIGDLCHYMLDKGEDYRSPGTVLRSLQRMFSEETKVSGEVFVLTKTLLRTYLKLAWIYRQAVWINVGGRYFETEMDGIKVALFPKTKGRWLIECRAPNGYSPPWGRWVEGFEAAKKRALFAVEETHILLAENEIMRGQLGSA